MSITLRIPSSQVNKIRQLAGFQVSLKWALLFSFILAFVVRLILELEARLIIKILVKLQ